MVFIIPPWLHTTLSSWTCTILTFQKKLSRDMSFCNPLTEGGDNRSGLLTGR